MKSNLGGTNQHSGPREELPPTSVTAFLQYLLGSFEMYRLPG